MAPDRTSFEHDSCHGDGCKAYLEGKSGAMLTTSKTTSGVGRKENVCFLCWHLAACFTRHPHTSIKQYLFQTQKSKFASPIIPAGTGRGCVKWISSRAGPGHCLAGSLRHFITQQHWALSVFPSSCPRLNGLPSSLGHHGDAGMAQEGDSQVKPPTSLLRRADFLWAYAGGRRIGVCECHNFHR